MVFSWVSLNFSRCGGIFIEFPQIWWNDRGFGRFFIDLEECGGMFIDFSWIWLDFRGIFIDFRKNLIEFSLIFRGFGLLVVGFSLVFSLIWLIFYWKRFPNLWFICDTYKVYCRLHQKADYRFGIKKCPKLEIRYVSARRIWWSEFFGKSHRSCSLLIEPADARSSLMDRSMFAPHRSWSIL